MKISEISLNGSPFTYLQYTKRLAAWSTYVQNYAVFPKLLSCPVFVHLAQFSYIDKTTFLHENARRKLMCQRPCRVLVVFSLRFVNKYWLSDRCLVYKANGYSGGGCLINPAVLIFFCPSLLGGFSYTQSTLSYVIYCLGKGSWQVTILRITTVKKRPV